MAFIAAIVGKPDFNALSVNLNGTPIQYGRVLTACVTPTRPLARCAARGRGAPRSPCARPVRARRTSAAAVATEQGHQDPGLTGEAGWLFYSQQGRSPSDRRSSPMARRRNENLIAIDRRQRREAIRRARRTSSEVTAAR